MARKAKPKAKKTTRKPAAAKRAPSRKAATKKPAPPQSSPRPSLSREVVEEILVHSAKSSDGEPLSDKALSEIAVCADLEPARVLDVHRQLCDAVEDSEMTVLRVVELWDPYE